VAGVETTSGVALDADLDPVVVPTEPYWRGSGVSSLAGFVAMWRSGLYATRTCIQLEDSKLTDSTRLASWLDTLRTSCEEATIWLTSGVFVPTGSADTSELIETVTEFLNRPLWRQRDLLYEVWVLCATLDAAERVGWTAELSGLTAADDVWVLTLQPATDPVARLRHADDPGVMLDVWREPRRATADGVLTPDVSVSTPGTRPSDLLVVEAKDRQRMAAGQQERAGKKGRRAFERRSALGVAQRYAEGPHPRVTWVGNHCDFDGTIHAATNHGDVWTRIHLAAQFRPRSVPPEFAASVRVALAPPDDVASRPGVTKKARPPVAGQQPGQHRQHDPVRRSESGPADLPAQHHQLVARSGDLHVFASAAGPRPARLSSRRTSTKPSVRSTTTSDHASPDRRRSQPRSPTGTLHGARLPSAVPGLGA
jgi:hypothetical protein